MFSSNELSLVKNNARDFSYEKTTPIMSGHDCKITNLNLTFRGSCIVIYCYNKNQRDTLISQIYLWNRTLHVSDSFSVHHQESNTVHTAIGIGHKVYADCLLASSQHNLYDLYLLLCVQCWTPDDGQRNCPKHVESYSKNKFEKLVHLVGFIIRV